MKPITIENFDPSRPYGNLLLAKINELVEQSNRQKEAIMELIEECEFVNSGTNVRSRIYRVLSGKE